MGNDLIEKRSRFDAILNEYGLSTSANWESLYFELMHPAPQGEDGAGMQGQELEGIIRLIETTQKGSGTLEIISGDGRKAEIKEAKLKRQLILSLHKYLYLYLGLDHPAENEAECGYRQLFTYGMKGWAKVGLKKQLQGEDAGFIEPFSEDELQALLDFAIQHQRTTQSYSTNARRGDLVADLLASCPDPVQAMGKTDKLNFIGDMMAAAGLLDDVPRWKALSDELAKSRRHNLLEGDIRKSRQKMIANWVGSAKNAYIKLHMTNCTDCKEFAKCIVPAGLQRYQL